MGKWNETREFKQALSLTFLTITATILFLCLANSAQSLCLHFLHLPPHFASSRILDLAPGSYFLVGLSDYFVLYARDKELQKCNCCS